MTAFRPPYRPADPAPAPALSDREAEIVARFEAAPVLAESSAVVRAMLNLADHWGGDDCDARYSQNRIAKSTAARAVRDAVAAALGGAS